MTVSSQPDILDSIEVPEALRQQWQSTLTLLGELLDIPAPLVMRARKDEIEVFAAGQREGNVYEERQKARLNTGLYCETVMATRSELHVPDARKNPNWNHNPDLRLGMIAYLGLPLEWPSRHVFGTICVLDHEERTHSELNRRILQHFRALIEGDLALVFENHLLRQGIAEREAMATEMRRIHDELRRVTARLQLVREQERAVIAHRLHDDIAQALTAAKMDLDACSRKMPDTVQTVMQPYLASTTLLLDGAIARVRSLFDDLVPAMLEDLGLVPTIEWEADEFTRRTGISCLVQAPKRLRRIERRTTLLLCRTVQQALSHVVELHARAVRIVLRQEGARTMLSLSATGQELTCVSAAAIPTFIAELRDEIESRGGSLQSFQSSEGETLIQVALPSNPPA